MDTEDMKTHLEDMEVYLGSMAASIIALQFNLKA